MKFENEVIDFKTWSEIANGDWREYLNLFITREDLRDVLKFMTKNYIRKNFDHMAQQIKRHLHLKDESKFIKWLGGLNNLDLLTYHKAKKPLWNSISDTFENSKYLLPPDNPPWSEDLFMAAKFFENFEIDEIMDRAFQEMVREAKHSRLKSFSFDNFFLIQKIKDLVQTLEDFSILYPHDLVILLELPRNRAIETYSDIADYLGSHFNPCATDFLEYTKDQIHLFVALAENEEAIFSYDSFEKASIIESSLQYL